MAKTMRDGTIQIHGTGPNPHLTRISVRPVATGLAVEVQIQGPVCNWGISDALETEHWSRVVDALNAARTSHQPIPMSPSPTLGKVEVDLGELSYVSSGGVGDLAFQTANILFELVTTLGGPTVSALWPERAIPFGNADDTIDDTALHASFHDTVPDSVRSHTIVDPKSE